jgi:long-chain fatty acid transport protein
MTATKPLRIAAACAALVWLCTVPASAQRVIESSLFSGSLGSGARALGMGGAFIAIADDATASSWNPAGLCVLEKPEASLVFQPYSRFTQGVAASTYQNSYLASGRTATQTERDEAYDITSTSASFDFFSFTYPFRAGSLKLVPQVSYQRMVDFGLDREYQYSYSGDYGYPGSTRYPYSGTVNYTSDNSGGIDALTLSLGVSFTQKLYLGVAVNRWGNGSEGTGKRQSQATITTWAGTTDTTSSEDYEGTNVNIGALFKPSQKFRLGAVFKSGFTMDQTWKRTTQGYPAAGAATTQVIDRTGTIQWPATFGVGIAFMPTDSLTVAADFTASQWAEADHSYAQTTTTTTGSSTTSRPASGKAIWPTFYTPSLPESSTNPAQVDTQQGRLGLEYMILKPGLFGVTALPLRLGFFSDKQYFKETPSLEEVRYLGFTGGVGFVWSRFSLDIAYHHTRAEYFSDYSTSTTSITSDEADTFRSHRFYVSTTVRF